MKVQARIVSGVSKDMLLEVVVTELSNGRSISTSQFSGQVSSRLADGCQLLVDPMLSRNRMALRLVASGSSRVLAANKQGAVMQAADEDDASILLQTQLVRAFRIIFDISPFGSVHLFSVEELIVATDTDLGLSFLVLGSK
jgi:hypothetical protein